MSAMTVTSFHGPLAPPAGPALTLVAGGVERPSPVPCAARPSTGFVHRDGRCQCFAGGPAPEFAPSRQPAATHGTRHHLSVAH